VLAASLLALCCATSVAIGAGQDPAPIGSQAPTPDLAVRPSFAEWLDGVRAEALARGIRADVVDDAFADVTEPVPVIIERDRTQAETVLSIEAYLRRQLTQARVRTGRRRMTEQKATLDRVSAAYGVPARIIGGIWGMESNFGQFSGVRPTIAALATLAWDPRRGTYFRKELFNALEIVNRGDIDLPRLRGSWAGAMGQPQFMPSSYLERAVDFDGDGRRDIWTSVPDVLGSIANYLKAAGWQTGERWGREVRVGARAVAAVERTVPMRTRGCRAELEMTEPRPLASWRALGVTLAGGAPLPESSMSASLVRAGRRAFLVYANFGALLDYNCSNAYALSAGLLADRVAGAGVVR
jgi:membrane-bound lytic murein transglycosylase B